MASLAHLAEQVLHVDAGADESVAESEGDERERDGGGQVRAAVLGKQLHGLVGPRPLLLLLPLAAFFSILILGAEYLQQRSATHGVQSAHVRGLASEKPRINRSVSRGLTFQRPNSRPYFWVISSAVFASPFFSCTAGTASCDRRGKRKAWGARKPRWCFGCGGLWRRCQAAATLVRNTAAATMVGWSGRSRAKPRRGQDRGESRL
jgi:hypothetical protein